MQSVKQTSSTWLDFSGVTGHKITRFSTIAYSILLIFWILAARFGGERWWPCSILLYLAPQVWLLPLGLLIPAALVFDRRMLAVLFFCVLLTVFCYAGCRLGLGRRQASAGSPFLTVVTNNIGENHRQSLDPFLREQNPDLIVIQDARRIAGLYRRVYPERSVAYVGEFVLISRYPIISAQPCAGPRWRLLPAAIFRVAWPGHPFTLYAVHIPTPRSDFNRLRGRGFLVDLARGGLWRNIAAYREAMLKRVEVAHALSEQMEREPGPVLAAGDFNMPSWGFVNSIFTARLTDAFDACGRGFGFSFPGDEGFPLRLIGPWLRLDRLFCNRGFVPMSCKVEENRRSQHRAVAARFEWVGNRH